MKEWIDIEIEKPKFGERVLIVSDATGQVTEAFRYKDKSFNRFGVDVEASHWMPLPEPPQ